MSSWPQIKLTPGRDTFGGWRIYAGNVSFFPKGMPPSHRRVCPVVSGHGRPMGRWDGGNVTTGERRTNWSHKEPKQNSFPMSLSPGEREHTARVPPLERVIGTVWLRVALRGEEPRVVLVHGAGVSSLYGVLLAPRHTPEP